MTVDMIATGTDIKPIETETELSDTQPLERNKAVAFKALLEHVALGGTDTAMLSSLASRLARLDKRASVKIAPGSRPPPAVRASRT